MRVTNVEITVVEVPQTAPLAPYRSRIRSSSTTRSAIVLVETDEGLTGCGEHNVNFLEGVSAREMQHAAQAWLVGCDPLNIALFHVKQPFETRLKSGVEMALWDIRGKAAGLPLSDLMGGVLRPEVEVAACMGIAEYGRARELAAWYVEQGFGTLKTKAGADMDEDLEMVRGIRDEVGDRLKLRIDPNCGYTREQSVELARRLEPYALEYLEQPLPEAPIFDAAWLRLHTKTPIGLNESVTTPASVMEIIKQGAADFVLPDTHIAGGLQPCIDIGRICEAEGLPCIMHCGHDLGPKTAAMVHVAAANAAYSLANDTTYYGLEDDVITERIPIVGGRIRVPARPGLGVEIDPEKLVRYRVDC
ncbi:MAG: mandelate racemase/muconate lactonizing enzyme family protein [Planctomycetaceae bacterium]|nr:mandelate racemase/muconate lactonizing enzyme family protein [Planctomycetaceae bacterium]